MATVNNVDPLSPVVINASVLQNPIPDNRLRRFGIVSLGDTTITAEISKDISKSEIASIFDTTTETYKTTYTYKWLVSFFANNPQGIAVVIELGEAGGTTEVPDVSTNIDKLIEFIDNDKNTCYNYSCPQLIYHDKTNVKTLVTNYSGITQRTSFTFELTLKESPKTSEYFINLAGLKAFFPVYPSAIETENASGAINGVLASPMYDLTTTNPMSPLQYTKIVGITGQEFDRSYRMELVNAGVNYIGLFQNTTVILNGRYADNFAWDYWYSFDFTITQITTYLLNALYNSANTPTASLHYNQQGIDSLKSVVLGRLFYGQSVGVITEFGEGINPDGSLKEAGSVYAIPFYTYRTNNPDKYASEIYDGLSAVVLIGKFFRQIVFNITIN